jgi:hypothetical protein
MIAIAPPPPGSVVTVRNEPDRTVLSWPNPGAALREPEKEWLAGVLASGAGLTPRRRLRPRPALDLVHA